jgi:hypothetical protein
MNSLLRGSVGAASAMFLVGSLAAVSSVINGYPLYGGQALRYALAAAILFAVAGARGQRLVVRLSPRESLLLLALAARRASPSSRSPGSAPTVQGSSPAPSRSAPSSPWSCSALAPRRPPSSPAWPS